MAIPKEIKMRSTAVTLDESRDEWYRDFQTLPFDVLCNKLGKFGIIERKNGLT
jgi:hypothetical protein